MKRIRSNFLINKRYVISKDYSVVKKSQLIEGFTCCQGYCFLICLHYEGAQRIVEQQPKAEREEKLD